jgi:hypothetical protein
MRQCSCLLIFFLFAGKSQALIHKKTEYFLDIELSNKDFFINCSGGPKDDNSILSINLMDENTYYNFYYRRVIKLKQCYEHKKEYMDMLRGAQFLRIVASHPTERPMLDSEKKAVPNPFNKAIKIIYGPFIRLQAGDKCKAYFSEDCDLPRNYWGGVIPDK